MAKIAKIGNRKTLLEQAADTSLNDRMQAVCAAVRDKYNDAPGDYTYVEVAFDDYVILRKGGDLWRVDYTVDAAGDVTLASDAVQVKVQYTPVSEGCFIGLMPDSDEAPKLKEGETAPKPTGKRWGVLIIQEGMSKNRNRYAKKVLQEAAPLYEGARIYMDHQEEQRRYGRSTRDVAGFLKDVRGVMVAGSQEATDAGTGRFALAATAVITKESVRRELMDAAEEGNTNLFGLSHDVNAESVTVMSDSGPFYDVQRIESVSSVDFVTNPAAGGRVLRLVASDTRPHTLEGDGRMLQKMIEAIKASGNQGLIAKLTALGATPTEDQVMGLYTEALKTPPVQKTEAELRTEREAEEKRVRDAAAAAAAAAGGGTQASSITEAEFMEVRKDGLLSFLDNTLEGTSLHEPVKEKLRTKLTARINEATGRGQLMTKVQITAEVKESVDLFAQLAEKNIVMPAKGMPRFEIVKGREDKIAESIDAFFGLKKDAQGVVKIDAGARMTSFRNLYIDITGDINVTGEKKEAKKLTESLTSASFDQILGDSITRRMVAEYQMGTQAQWRGTIAEVVPINDFRTQRRMRFGGYGNLVTVGQGAPYPSMTSPTDEEATYAPSKRGGTEQLTIEMIANDDVGAIRRIPQRLARAASQTLYEFVFDFLRLNSNVYDGTALAAAGHGNNIVTTALSASNISVLRLRMKNQTDMSNSKRIGLAARYLFVPNDLEELAFQITGADRAVPDAALAAQAAPAAPNFIRAQGIKPVVVDYWTDANDYWLSADPTQTPMIEIGFWGGEDPQLFVQDVPNVGSLFSNDAITYKMRHVYGGAPLDFRGFGGGIVP